jgi:predicted RecA/RadA family phage recombinase
MATNERISPQSDYNLQVIPSAKSPVATPASGDPVVFGQMPGVCQTDALSDGSVVISTKGVFDVSVKGADDQGNVAVNAGDKIYFYSAKTPHLSKEQTGTVPFGIAYAPSGGAPTVAAGSQLIASGSTATISVKVGS